MDINPQMQLARQYVEFTHQNIFLTGRAGTGKTTFLKELRQSVPKQAVVVAPTGIAAINAQGVTIHSLFQIAPGIHLPGGNNPAEERQHHFRMSDRKKALLRSFDLLVIDEISMVRCDLLDSIDRVLRLYRDRTRPFGGVQLLFIGDLQQLAPVAKDNEWQLLRPYYETPYFFSSHAFKQLSFTTIELTHIFRQSNREFIDLLAQIRSNSLTPESYAKLNNRYLPDFTPPDGKHWIHLTTHNATANSFNANKLNAISQPEYRYEAEIEGNFPESSYPADTSIVIKKGAQVMFIKNDPSIEKRYFNGKIGIVTDVTESYVEVTCEGDESPIDCTPVTWENIRYDLNTDTGQLKESVDGTFTQMPLRLAWAITVHKSQGLTFDHAVIDINRSFAHGQTYVALSRCRTLEGLVLSQPLSASAIICDNSVENFVNYQLQISSNSSAQLPEYKRQYLGTLLDELFNFSPLADALEKLFRVVKDYTFLLQQDFVPPLETAGTYFRKEASDISLRFRQQYMGMIQRTENCFDDPQLQQRIKDAANYFVGRITSLILPVLSKCVLKFDNKEAKKRFSSAVQQVTTETRIKLVTLNQASDEGFDIKHYLVGKIKAANENTGLELPTIEQANEKDSKPQTAEKKSRKKEATAKTKEPKPRTIDETLRLFNEGKTIKEIAAERGLQTTTIESHLAKLAGENLIDINTLVTPEHQQIIREAIKAFTSSYLLSELKAALPDHISYAEIKAVEAVVQRENNN